MKMSYFDQKQSKLRKMLKKHQKRGCIFIEKIQWVYLIQALRIILYRFAASISTKTKTNTLRINLSPPLIAE